MSQSPQYGQPPTGMDPSAGSNGSAGPTAGSGPPGHSSTGIGGIEFSNFQGLSYPATKQEILQQAASLPPEQQRWLQDIPDQPYNSLDQLQDMCRQMLPA